MRALGRQIRAIALFVLIAAGIMIAGSNVAEAHGPALHAPQQAADSGNLISSGGNNLQEEENCCHTVPWGAVCSVAALATPTTGIFVRFADHLSVRPNVVARLLGLQLTPPLPPPISV